MAKRVMIVDDEALIAFEIELFLEDEGFDVVGTAPGLDAAMRLLARGEIDAVLLDANLGGVSSSPIARDLRDREVPFVVVSGYAAGQIDWLEDAPLITKPVDYPRLAAVLREL